MLCRFSTEEDNEILASTLCIQKDRMYLKGTDLVDLQYWDPARPRAYRNFSKGGNTYKRECSGKNTYTQYEFTKKQIRNFIDVSCGEFCSVEFYGECLLFSYGIETFFRKKFLAH